MNHVRIYLAATFFFIGLASLSGQRVQPPEGGGLWAFGTNGYGQLGDGWLEGGSTNPRKEPVQIANHISYKSVSAGSGKSLFLDQSGMLQGSGRNLYATNPHTPALASANVPTGLGGSNISQFPTPNSHPPTGDSVFAAGSSTRHFFGSNSEPGASPQTATLYYYPAYYLDWNGNTKLSAYPDGFSLPGETLRAVVASEGHCFGLTASQRLYGWERNNLPGQGEWKSFFSPPLDGIISVATGRYSVYYVKNDGSLWAMGSNQFGQLGLGTTSPYPTETFARVADGVRSVHAGYRHALMVKTDGTLWTFGYNSNGQLGNESHGDSAIPVKVASNVTEASGGFSHSLFRKADGTLWGMGSNGFGELGLANLSGSSKPLLIARDVTSFSAGGSHSLYVGRNLTRWASLEFKGGFIRKPCYVDAVVQLSDADGYGVVLPQAWLNPPEETFSFLEDGQVLSKNEHNLQMERVKSVATKTRTVLLLDCSSSMGLDFLKVKKAASVLVDSMLGNQEISLVSFSGKTKVVQAFTSDKAALKKAIDGLALGDASTDLYGGVSDYLGSWTEKFSLAGIETGFMVVLTDGKDTTGRSSLQATTSKRDTLKRKIFVLAVGSQTDTAALKSLANGGHFYVDGFDALGDAFIEVQNKIRSLGDSLYWVNYASPKRGDATRSFSVGYKHNQNKGLGSRAAMTFNSNGFGDLQRSVVVNRSVYSSSGVGEVGIPLQKSTSLDITTLLPVTTSSYSYRASDRELFTLQTVSDDGSKVDLKAGNTSGVGTLTITDDPNHQAAKSLGIDPASYTRTIRIVVGTPPVEPSTPEISVDQPAGSPLKDGISSTLFGTMNTKGKGRSKIYSIRNLGKAPLKNIKVAVKGKHAKDFQITMPKKTELAPGASVTFALRFLPNAKGTRRASLLITSSDADESPFDVRLQGLGVR